MRRTLIASLVICGLIASCGVPPPPETSVEPQERGPVDVACRAAISSLPSFERKEGWSIVTRRDLLSSDLELWNQHRDADACPGVAQVDLNGDGEMEFAVTEIRRSGDALSQRLLVLRPASEGERRIVAWEADSVPFAYVVFASNEREARDFYTGEVTPLPRQSFVFERLEAWAVVYYEADGELKTVLVSD